MPVRAMRNGQEDLFTSPGGGDTFPRAPIAQFLSNSLDSNASYEDIDGENNRKCLRSPFVSEEDLDSMMFIEGEPLSMLFTQNLDLNNDILNMKKPIVKDNWQHMSADSLNENYQSPVMTGKVNVAAMLKSHPSPNTANGNMAAVQESSVTSDATLEGEEEEIGFEYTKLNNDVAESDDLCSHESIPPKEGRIGNARMYSFPKYSDDFAQNIAVEMLQRQNGGLHSSLEVNCSNSVNASPWSDSHSSYESGDSYHDTAYGHDSAFLWEGADEYGHMVSTTSGEEFQLAIHRLSTSCPKMDRLRCRERHSYPPCQSSRHHGYTVVVDGFENGDLQHSVSYPVATMTTPEGYYLQAPLHGHKYRLRSRRREGKSRGRAKSEMGSKTPSPFNLKKSKSKSYEKLSSEIFARWSMESSGFSKSHGNSSHSNCSSLVEDGAQRSPPSVTRAHSFGSADLNRKERPTVSRAHSMSSADRSSSSKNTKDTWKQRCIRSKSFEKLSLRLQSASDDEDFIANPEIVCPAEDSENEEEPKTPDTSKRVTFAEIAQRKKNMSLPVQPLIDSGEGKDRLDTGKHSDEGVFSGEWTEGGNECEEKRRWSEKEKKERLNSEGIEVDEEEEDDGIIENASGNEVAMEESLKLRRESLESEKSGEASGRSRLFSDPGPKKMNEVTLRDNLSSYQLPAMKGWQKDGDAEEEMTSYVAIETPPDNIPLSPSCSGEFILVDLRRKKALVSAVNSAVDAILGHFGEAREPSAKARLGNSSKTPNIGHLVLRYLCPAMLALVKDGLRPFLRNPIVGRVKNNVWNVVESSTQMGPATKSLHKLFNHLSKTGQMWDINMRFNAFVCGLLNLKAVELWLTHLQARYDIVQKHYIPEAFLTLSYTAGRQLFEDVVVIVQPLSLLPFALDTQFEFNIKQEEMEREIGKQRLKEEAARTSPRSTFQMMTGKRIPRYQPSRRMEEERQEEQEEEVMVIDRRQEVTPVAQDQTPKVEVDSAAGEDQQSTEQPKNQNWWFQLMNSTPVEAATDRKTSETTSTVSEAGSEANPTTARSKLWLSNLIGAGPRPNQEARSKVNVTVTQEVKQEDQQKTLNGKKSRWASFSSSLIQAVDRVLLPTTSRTPPPSPRQHHSNQTPPASPRQQHSNQMQPSSPRQHHSNQTPHPSPRQQHSNQMTRREEGLVQNHRKDGKRVVKALCHHLATEDGQLSLAKGDILTVLRQVDDDWLLCCHGNKTGLVLTGCVNDLDLL
ncbi:uncharacterized protein [Branchiostoma lanceolatum]|uniref:uncharacterized protein isoform X8 n=1 Tax=Branchiostoma lanceolatum TaxID=7740 RepID=UPI003455C20B